MTTTTLDIDTPHGPALAHLHEAANAVGALVLGHGAGGGFGAPDLIAATKVALSLGVSVAHVEQPYRVAGRRSAAPAHQLDASWLAAIAELCAGPFAGLPIVAGGRSSGARVACRTASATGAAGVLCLAFPLQPPARKASGTPSPSRLAELDAVWAPVLVVQGEGDPFGVPPFGPTRIVVSLRGNHSLRSDVPGLTAAIAGWLGGVLGT